MDLNLMTVVVTVCASLVFLTLTDLVIKYIKDTYKRG